MTERASDAASCPISVVVATRDRRERLLRTLAKLAALPEAPPIVVVDNGSHDGSADAVRQRYADIQLIALSENRGAAGRTSGVQAATTPYVAFADDDSWWEAGALARAAEHFERHPRLGLLAARILVGPERRLDPASAEMARSPLTGNQGLPGTAILGFVACGAAVRRDAYLQVGGFSELLFFRGEEQLLALDLAAAGWDLVYAPDVVAHHHPERSEPSPRLHAQQLRNDLLSSWMRRPWRVALGDTRRLAADAVRQPAARAALAGAARRVPAAWARRRPLPPHVEQQVRLLRSGRGSG